MMTTSTQTTAQELNDRLSEVRKLRALVGVTARDLATVPSCREVEMARMFVETTELWMDKAERRIGGELMAARQANFKEEEAGDD